MERSITEHNGAGFGEEYLFVSAPGAMGVFQFERIAKMAEDLDSVIEALSSAKLSLGKAVEQMTTGTAASNLSEAQLSRLKALSDQNTGCQNSGCGGAEAALAAKPGVRK